MATRIPSIITIVGNESGGNLFFDSIYLSFIDFFFKFIYKRYFVKDAKKLEKLAHEIASKTYDCTFYIRHKTFLFPPSLLRDNGIEFARVSLDLVEIERLRVMYVSQTLYWKNVYKCSTIL